MRGEKKEHWLSLCEQAAQEQDPDKLMDLVKEITRLLDEKQERLRGAVQILAKQEARQAMGRSSELMSRQHPGFPIVWMSLSATGCVQ